MYSAQEEDAGVEDAARWRDKSLEVNKKGFDDEKQARLEERCPFVLVRVGSLVCASYFSFLSYL